METNIDYRLDLYNAVEHYTKNMDEDNDAIFLITINTNSGDAFSSLTGNIDNIIRLMCSKDGIKKTDDYFAEFESSQNFILNCAINILCENAQKREKFQKWLNDIKN
jgi:hypothetical protein